VWPISHSCPSLFSFFGQRDFCLNIIPVHALCLSQCNPHYCTPSPFPHPLLFNTFLEQFQQVSLFSFRTYIQSSLTIFAILYPLPCLSVYLLFKGSHLSISHMCILHFNQIDSLYYYLLFLYHSAPPLFNSLQCISLHHLHTQMQCILILFTIILFSSSTSIMVSLSFTHTYVDACKIIYVCTYTCIF
jgi:hypothetical protein